MIIKNLAIKFKSNVHKITFFEYIYSIKSYANHNFYTNFYVLNVALGIFLQILQLYVDTNV